jgi:sulfotransferase family protein
MSLGKPLIIVGTGRCGSTMFFRLLAAHPDVMWLSGFADRYPTKPKWNRWAVSALDSWLVHQLLGHRIVPGERYHFWDCHAPGFSAPYRDLLQEDVTPQVKERVRATLELMLSPTRNRLLLKVAGWSRIGFFNEILEDARFVHLVRDGRAVANSLLHVDFWRGWQGPQGWRAGPLSPEDQAAWEKRDCSFVTLAGLLWKIRVRATERARQALHPNAFLQINYETLCEQPLDTYRRVLEFAELPNSPALEHQIKAATIRNMSNRWRADLTAAQQAELTDLLQEDLSRYGYEA